MRCIHQKCLSRGQVFLLQRFPEGVYNSQKQKIAEDMVEHYSLYYMLVCLQSLLVKKNRAKTSENKLQHPCENSLSTFQVKKLLFPEFPKPFALVGQCCISVPIFVWYKQYTKPHDIWPQGSKNTAPNLQPSKTTCPHAEPVSCTIHVQRIFVCWVWVKNDYEITVTKAILIQSHKPNLNKQLPTNGTSFMIKIFESSLL